MATKSDTHAAKIRGYQKGKKGPDAVLARAVASHIEKSQCLDRPMSDKEDARAQLLKRIEPGQTVYTLLRHVSGPGMTRRIDVYIMEENKPYFITGLVGKAAGYRHEFRKGGLVVSGCGMDMGFEVVYNLGRALWPNGAASALHAADRTWTKNRNGDKGPETDGGYMLRQEWL